MLSCTDCLADADVDALATVPLCLVSIHQIHGIFGSLPVSSCSCLHAQCWHLQKSLKVERVLANQEPRMQYFFGFLSTQVFPIHVRIRLNFQECGWLPAGAVMHKSPVSMMWVWQQVKSRGRIQWDPHSPPWPATSGPCLETSSPIPCPSHHLSSNQVEQPAHVSTIQVVQPALLSQQECSVPVCIDTVGVPRTNLMMN